MTARSAVPEDAEAIARIYNQGIADRTATFETRLRSADDVRRWFDGRHPIMVVEDGAGIVAFAATSGYRPRECYAGIAEFSVYVDRSARRQGAGRLAMESLIRAAAEAGFWKLVSRIFTENHASLRLCRSLGFRQVGTYEKHGQLDDRSDPAYPREVAENRGRVRINPGQGLVGAGGAPGLGWLPGAAAGAKRVRARHRIPALAAKRHLLFHTLGEPALFRQPRQPIADLAP